MSCRDDGTLCVCETEVCTRECEINDATVSGRQAGYDEAREQAARIAEVYDFEDAYARIRAMKPRDGGE